MAKYSRVYKRGKRSFRYDYENRVVQVVYKEDAEIRADNIEWMGKYGYPLWEVENGYVVVDSAGLSLENWKDKESRDYYLSCYDDDLSEEAAYEADFFMKYEYPKYVEEGFE